ncbi:MAG: hypothetical protein ABR562_05660 [Thermoplasmatota archaeon]
MSNANHDATNANRNRWGGILLLAGVLLITAAALLRDVGFKPDAFAGTGSATAAAITANHGLFTSIYWLRAVGAMLACVGGLFLATRPTATPGNFPASAFWLAFGLGQLVATGVNILRATGYVTLAGNYATAGPVFDATRSTMTGLAALATVGIVGGVLVVFWNEARNAAAAIPAWLCYAGVACTLPVLASMLLGLFGTGTGASDAATLLGYFTYGLNAVGLLFAFRLGWPNLQFVWSQPQRSTA